MNNLDIYNKAKAVPDNAKKKITGGRMSGMTDINPVWRIKKLTELFGPCGVGWYYTMTRKWLEAYGDEVAAFVDIDLYIRLDGEWSKPIQGTGGNMFAKKEKGGIFISDECFKMATTDAISVACKQLGIGADVYWESDRSKYTVIKDQKDAPPQATYSERLSPVFNELKRTGYSAESVMKLYKVSSLEKMTNLQINDFLKKIRNVADKKAMVQDETYGKTS